MAEKPLILVSISPYKFFVEQIAQDKVTIQVVVPPGASSHTFEPTAKQMLNASKAFLWFGIGEAFEDKVFKALKNKNLKLKLVDLQQGFPLISESCCHCHKNFVAYDLHTWLSPKNVQVQMILITKYLQELLPKYAEEFANNLKNFNNQLKLLDQEISNHLKDFNSMILMVSHPAYGYFCRDYHLKQLSIEIEGKDPTAKQVNHLLEIAKKENVQAIFTQVQYSNKAALLIAQHLQIKLLTVDPYAEDYINNLKEITKLISENLKLSK